MLLVLLLAILIFQGPVEPQLLKLGAPAPPLAVHQLLQAPPATLASWESLRGKAVVLEFWATWCGGCVDSIPHLNELAEEFKDRPIHFISITDEEDSVLVSRFLQKRRINGWVALDVAGSTFKNYDVLGRPHTILVDAQGILRAITTPQGVTESVLEDLLAGKPLDFPQPSGSPVIGAERFAPTPLIQVLIRPAAPVAVTGMSAGAVREKNGRYESWGLTLKSLLSSSYGFPPEFIEAPEWCSQTKYDFTVMTPQNGESEQMPLVQQALVTAFRLKLRREMRETDVYLLQKIPGREPRLQAATTQGSSQHWDRNGELEVTGKGLVSLVQVAQSVSGLRVFDETALNGRYDFDLKWNGKDPASFLAAVRDQLGLELVPARKPLEYLVIVSADEPKTW